MNRNEIARWAMMIGIVVSLVGLVFATVRYEDYNDATKDLFWSETDSRVDNEDAFWAKLQAQRGLFQASLLFAFGMLTFLGGLAAHQKAGAS